MSIFEHKFVAVCLAISLFGALSDEVAIVICSIAGSSVAVVFNFTFIRNNKSVGIAFGLFSFFFPIIVIQTLLDSCEPCLKLAKITACVFGLFSFQTVKYFFEHQENIVSKVVNAFINVFLDLIKRIGKEKEDKNE